MLIAIIRYANNKRHFIIFDLSCTIIPSLSPSLQPAFLCLLRENSYNSASSYSRTYIYCFSTEPNNRMDHEWMICSYNIFQNQTNDTKTMPTHQEKNFLNCYTVLFKVWNNRKPFFVTFAFAWKFINLHQTKQREKGRLISRYKDNKNKAANSFLFTQLSIKCFEGKCERKSKTFPARKWVRGKIKAFEFMQSAETQGVSPRDV